LSSHWTLRVRQRF